MRIALFSDIHGKFLLPFKLAALYQEETGNRIDLILQCGDMGAYPDIHNLDKATVKHARSDRDELGFYDDFLRPDPEIGAFLDRLNIPMICVRGNHEDHDFLDRLEKESDAARFPIDAYGRVFVCKSGHRQEFRAGDVTLLFAGVGRIGDRKGRSEKRFIQDFEREQLRRLHKENEVFDILITHDKDNSGDQGYGMPEIRELLDKVLFHYHFYGHTGQPFTQQTDSNGITQSVKIKELEFGADGILPAGCMVLLQKDAAGNLQMEVVSQKLSNRLAKHNWRFA